MWDVQSSESSMCILVHLIARPSRAPPPSHAPNAPTLDPPSPAISSLHVHAMPVSPLSRRLCLVSSYVAADVVWVKGFIYLQIPRGHFKRTSMDPFFRILVIPLCLCACCHGSKNSNTTLPKKEEKHPRPCPPHDVSDGGDCTVWTQTAAPCSCRKGFIFGKCTRR